MGYVVGYKQYRDFTEQEWLELGITTTVILANLPAHSESGGGWYAHELLLVAGPSGEEGTKPVINANRIAFNGSGLGEGGEDLSHELFQVFRTREQLRRWYLPHRDLAKTGYAETCKTDRKPYDLVVKAVMLAMERIAPDAITLYDDDGHDADGEPCEFNRMASFAPASELLETALGKIPVDLD